MSDAGSQRSSLSRRQAVQGGLIAGSLLVSGAAGQQSTSTNSATQSASLNEVPVGQVQTQALRQPIFMATWPFGLAACERSRTVLSQTGSLLDAVEQGVNLTELDPAVTSVGYGGWPNAAGVVQLDACIMDGSTQRAGSVAGLEGFANPISVARRVMEQTRHVMLVGAGAAEFARQQGFETRSLLTDSARQAWEEWRSKPATPKIPAANNHDTIALLGLGKNGQLAGGCSTSGMAFKLPGRVGDSPLIGSGLYVDGQVGAAGATGIGENVLRYCASFLIVELMRQGKHPQEACQAAIERIAAGEKRPPRELSVNFVAMNREGQVGAAGTDSDFRCAVVDGQQSWLVKPVMVA